MPPIVFWITGLSGAGKSTVSHLLAKKMRSGNIPVLELDGDVLRAIFADATGHATDDRLKLAQSYARLCREVATQGISVICATVSMFHEVRLWNRKHIPGYREIYLRVPLDELKARDPKGLYAASSRGELKNLVGLDLPAELPENPDLTIDNHAGTSPQNAVELIWKSFTNNRDSQKIN